MSPKFLSFAVVLLFFEGCASKPQEAEKAPAPVQVTSATQATIRRIVKGDGAIFPVDQANLMPKLAAPVQKFYVNRGDHVKQGQLLAVLENRDLVAAVTESKDAVEVAESNLRATEGATIPESVVKAQIDVETARDARDNAKKSWTAGNNCSRRALCPAGRWTNRRRHIRRLSGSTARLRSTWKPCNPYPKKNR